MFLLYTATAAAAARFKQKHVTNLYKHTDDEVTTQEKASEREGAGAGHLRK